CGIREYLGENFVSGEEEGRWVSHNPTRHSEVFQPWTDRRSSLLKNQIRRIARLIGPRRNGIFHFSTSTTPRAQWAIHRSVPSNCSAGRGNCADSHYLSPRREASVICKRQRPVEAPDASPWKMSLPCESFFAPASAPKPVSLGAFRQA